MMANKAAMELMAESTVRAVSDFVGRCLAPVIGRVAELERRLIEIENRPEPKYLGVFKEGQTYRAGSMVTCSGSLWFANEMTRIRPGSAGSGWTLAVKQGCIPSERRS